MAHSVRHSEVIEVTPSQMLLVGHLDAMKGNGYAQPFRFGPEGIVITVIPRPAIDLLVGQYQSHGSQFLDATPRLCHRALCVMRRQKSGRFQARAVGAAEIGEPVVKGSANRSAKFRIQSIARSDMGAAGANTDA